MPIENPDRSSAVSSDLEHLLQRVDRVRELARALVRDAATADDVVQDALVAALGREGGPPRESSWLHRAVRSLAADRARGETGRRRREEAAARDERLAGAAESVARVELSRDVAAAVLALEEPSRSAITLRYVDGLPPREIARRTGAPVPTVKKRIERGLAQLRATLEDRYGGGGQWAVALLPLTGREAVQVLGAAATSIPSPLAGKALHAIAAGLVVSTVVWIGWHTLQHGGAELIGDPVPGLGPEVVDGRADGGPAGDSIALEAPAGGEGEDQRVTVAPAVVESIVRDGSAATTELLFVDMDGRPRPGLVVTWREALDGGSPLEGEVTREARRFVGDDGTCSVAAFAQDHLELEDRRLAMLRPIRLATGGRVVVVAPAIDVGGDCVDESGDPIAGAEVEFSAVLSASASFPLEVDGLGGDGRRATTDVDGRFELKRLPMHPSFALRACRGDGAGLVHLALPRSDDPGVRFVLPEPRPNEIMYRFHGRVLGETGSPVANARVRYGSSETVARADGAYLLGIPGSHTFSTRQIIATLDDGRFGAVPSPDLAAARGPEGSGPHDILVPEEMESLDGVVVDLDGAPVADVTVHIVDATPMGSGNRSFESGRLDGFASISTDELGRFHFEGLQPREYLLRVIEVESFLTADARIDPTEGPCRIVLGGGGGPVAGRVVDAFGAPAVAVEVTLTVTTHSHGDGSRRDEHGPSVLTDEQGRFAFPTAGRSGVGLTVSDPSAPIRQSLATRRTLEVSAADLEIEVELLCEVAFNGDLADGVDSLLFEDEDGERTLAWRIASEGMMSGTRLPTPSPGGAVGTLFVSQRAARIVFRGEGGEVASTPIRPTPGRVTRVDV